MEGVEIAANHGNSELSHVSYYIIDGLAKPIDLSDRYRLCRGDSVMPAIARNSNPLSAISEPRSSSAVNTLEFFRQQPSVARIHPPLIAVYQALYRPRTPDLVRWIMKCRVVL